MTHDKLTKIASKWLKKHSQNIIVPNCPTVISEVVAATPNGEIPDVIGWCSWASVLIEVKVSRGDYFRDFDKPFRAYNNLGMGELKYYLCPKDMIAIDEVPDSWGLLYCNDKGKIAIVKEAVRHDANLRSERTLLLSIIRRSKL